MLNFRTENKIALVTGCSSGIGMAIAIELAHSGADIIGVSNDMPESGSEVSKAVEAAGKKFYPYVADFSNRDSLYAFLNKVKADHPRIDIIINNAGHIMREPAATHSDEYWDLIININLDAQFIITRELGKRMLEQKYGKIVFTCSLLSFQGGINVPGYAASKGAVASLLKAFANEWAPHGIRVNAVAPGRLDTASPSRAAKSGDAKYMQAMLDRIPLHRLATAEDVAEAVAYLAGPRGGFVTGHTIVIDGGLTAY